MTSPPSIYVKAGEDDGRRRARLAMAPKAEEIRKGPWTEQEDSLLVRYVRLFGERRWDCLAKVSGLSGGGG